MSGTDAQLVEDWNRMKVSTGAYAESMSQLCREPFDDLLLHEAEAFCRLGPPLSAAEAESRVTQRAMLSAKTGIISYVSTMTGLHPGVAPQLVEMAKQFCNEVTLDDDVYERARALEQQVIRLCQADTQRSLRG